MKLLTIDQAFNDSNFPIIEAALFDLNKFGINDPDFLNLIRPLIDSRDGAANFSELTVNGTVTQTIQ